MSQPSKKGIVVYLDDLHWRALNSIREKELAMKGYKGAPTMQEILQDALCEGTPANTSALSKVVFARLTQAMGEYQKWSEVPGNLESLQPKAKRPIGRPKKEKPIFKHAAKRGRPKKSQNEQQQDN